MLYIMEMKRLGQIGRDGIRGYPPGTGKNLQDWKIVEFKFA